MTLIVHTAFSYQICRLKKYVHELNTYHSQGIETFEIKFTKTGLIQSNLNDLIEIAKSTSKIILHIQPLKKEHKNPQIYFQKIWSFLSIDPSFKNKTFFLQPFYCPEGPSVLEIKLLNKIILGEFRTIYSKFIVLYLPATEDQAFKLFFTILSFLNSRQIVMN